jgi:DNA-binding transcriptional LysR family regulator
MTMKAHLDAANLLALEALLEERHVTRAARRLGLSQSSMSHRLQRLRETLKDPLFVRVGGALVPSPRAEALAGPLATALDALRAAVAPPPTFDPRSSRYALTVAMPDLLMPLVPAILGALSEAAPLVTLHVSNVVPRLDEALASGSPALALAPAGFAELAISRSLGELRFGVVGRRGHPAFRRALTKASWLAHGHVVVRIGNERANVIGEELARRGLKRRVALEVPSFMAGLLVVAGSDLLMNAPLPIVQVAARAMGLTLRESPVPLPRPRFALLWHERYRHDPAHAWARELVFEAVRSHLDLSLSPRVD